MIGPLRMLAACTAALLTPIAPAATLTAEALAPGDLVITEYLANPVGASDADAEYFEVFNTSSHTFELAGLVVRDDGSNAFTVSALAIGPRSFAVFANSDGAALSLTPDYVYGTAMALTNTADEIGLYRPDDTLIGKVSYTDGDAFGAGIAHELALLNDATPTLLSGPSAGTDFIAATGALPLGNFGSPGSAGGTDIAPPAVPLPAGAWLLLSGLVTLGRGRRRARATASPVRAS